LTTQYHFNTIKQTLLMLSQQPRYSTFIHFYRNSLYTVNVALFEMILLGNICPLGSLAVLRLLAWLQYMFSSSAHTAKFNFGLLVKQWKK